MPAIPVRIISPGELDASGDTGPFPIGDFERQCLAQGDSWFSIGTWPPFLTTNLLLELELARGTCIVNCASPGKHLKTMVDTTQSPVFLGLLAGAKAREWSAILVSGGGNDLIAAAQSEADDPAKRLFARPAEWGPASEGGARYLSTPGWTTFQFYLRLVFDDLEAARASGINKDTPIVFHTYDVPAPRNAPAGPGFGPWLSKALAKHGVPEADWNAATDALYDRLHVLLKEIATRPNLHLVDTLGTLTKASNDDEGASADWQNEIHPTRRGYDKLGVTWEKVLNDLFQ